MCSEKCAPAPLQAWLHVIFSDKGLFSEADSLVCFASIHPALNPESEEHPSSDLQFWGPQ